MIKQITIKEYDWDDSKFKTIEWEKSVNITRWEHDLEKGIYIITYNACVNAVQVLQIKLTATN